MFNLKLIFTFEAFPRDVDLNKEMTLTSLGGTILDAAGLAAREQGFGMEWMHQHGLAWVVSRLAIEMDRFPSEYETFTIETWIENISALVSTRHFLIRNAQEDIIGRATSLWSLIDLQKRKPVNLLEKKTMMPYIEGSSLEIYAPKRIPHIPDNAQAIHRVVYSDIDINRHVNSFKYVQWVLDTLPLEHFITYRARRFDVNYTTEALYGETIFCSQSREDDITLYDLKNESGNSLCRMSIQWESRTENLEQGTV